MSSTDLHTLDQLPALIIALDAGGVVTWSNGASGLPADAQGKAVAALVSSADDAARLERALADVAAGRDAGTFEVSLAGAPARTVAFCASAAEGPGGARLLLTGVDVTAQRQADARRHDLEHMASTVVAVAPDAIVSVDREQRIVLFNDEAEKLFGYARAEVQGQPLTMLMPERYRAGHRAHLERFAAQPATVRTMGSQRAAITGLKKSGAEFPATAGISRHVGGGRVVLTAAIRDTTEERRREREQAVLAQVSQVFEETLSLEDTLHAIAVLVVGELADYCVIDLVAAGGEVRLIEALSRDPAKQGLCQRLRELPLDPGRPFLLKAALDARQAVHLPLREPRLGDYAQSAAHLEVLRAMAPHSIIAVPLVAHGRLLGGLGLINADPARAYGPPDVQLAGDLAQRAALAVDAAQHFLAAQRAIQARDDVLGIVAHDLRNPLQALLLQARSLKRRAGDGEHWTGKPADLIERAAVRMARLIQDLLDVTRMEVKSLVLEPEPLSVTDVLREVADAQRSLAARAGLTLTTETGPGLPDVTADRHRLLQVFENLVGNALKFTPRGGAIVVGARRTDGEVLFSVADTGPGIPQEEVPHLFDRFWQARKASRRGAGLGLPIARGVVEAHGGRIWVDTRVGEGTTFFFTLPIAQPAATDEFHDVRGADHVGARVDSAVP